jgi:peptide deformylase
MPVRQVIYVGDDRLRQKAKKVKQFTPALKQLAQDMVETMRHYQGVGLAGPQIGVMQRVFVAEIPVISRPANWGDAACFCGRNSRARRRRS